MALRTIEVRPQVSLPLGRTFQLCIHGIRHRLFRSAITVAIVALAVAFLMMMLSTSYIDRQVGQDVHRRTAPRELLAGWMDLLTTPLTADRLQALLVDGRDYRQSLRQWGDLGDSDLARLDDLARRQAAYDRFLTGLKPGERAGLVGSRQGQAVYLYLSEPSRLDEFFSRLESEAGGAARAFPGDKSQLHAFVQDLVQAQPLREKVLAGHARAVKDLGGQAGPGGVLAIMAEPSEPNDRLLAKAGFFPPGQERASMCEPAGAARDFQQLTGLLRNERMRRMIAARTATNMPDVDAGTLLKLGSSSGGAAFLADEAKKTEQEMSVELGMNLPAGRIKDLCREQLEQERLSAIQARLGGGGDEAFLGFSRRTAWLIAISFVVCAVGVANAMLMSVTERFREIATMKCLGALDSYIMISFVLESGLQGLTGGLIGVLLGTVLGMLRSLWGVGWLAMSNLPGMELSASAGACLLAGVVLASLAAIYPAWVAARLAPMEAMRIE